MLTCSGCQHTITFDKDKQTSSTVADILSALGFPHVSKDVAVKHKEFTDSLVEGFEVVGNENGKVDGGLDQSLLKTDGGQSFLRAMLEFFDDLTRINQPICGSCVQKVVSECESRGALVQDAHEKANIMLQHVKQCHLELQENKKGMDGDNADGDVSVLAAKQQEQSERRVKLEERQRLLQARQQEFEQKKIALGLVQECVRNAEARKARAALDQQAGLRQGQEVLRRAHEDVRAKVSGTEVLMKLNPLHDLACIGAEGLVAHIGGFRLGRLAEVNVEAQEIAEALGLVALLVDSIKKRFNLTRFASASVHPNGYQSFQQRVEDGKTQTLPLYKESTGVPVLQANKLDLALVTLAGCLQELANRAAVLGYDVSMLATVDKDRIGGLCVSMSTTKNEEWTQAMRLLLINLHCLCKFAIQHGTN